MNLSIKKVPCSECNGSGIIVDDIEYSISCKMCEGCNGLGYHINPITIADNIRTMSDEDLAGELLNYFSDGYDNHGRCNFNKKYEEILKRLQQPLNDNWREELVKPMSRL